MLKPSLLAGALIAASLAACAPKAQKVEAPKFDAARISEHVKVLASDEFQGRAPATEGETKTVDYIVGQMKAAGLQPGGDLQPDGQRAWTQDVPLARFVFKGPVKSSFTAGGQTTNLTQGEQIALRASATGETHVSVAGAPVVFVGYGVKAPERGWDDFKGVDLKGKIALVLVNDPDFEGGEGDFGGKAMTYYGRWTYKFEEAARQGAVGFLVIHETAPASYGWATVKGSNTEDIFDIIRKDPKASHAPVEGWIHRDLTVDLFKKAGLDFEAAKAQARTKAFKPIALNGVSFSATYDVDATKIVSKNIAGMLPGTKHPDEFVVYSGHWDHLGVGPADAKGDTIYNGALDNASGIAAIIEMGRAFAAAPRTERSLLFLAVTAEERGLLGTEYYASNPLYPLSKTVAAFNLDMFAAAGPMKNFSVSGDSGSTLQDDLIEAGKRHNLGFAPDARPEAGLFYRSDHFPLAKRGVPAISLESGEDLVNGGVEAGKKWKDAFDANNYHQPSDEWRADLDLSGEIQIMDMTYDLGRELADSREWPGWKDGSEFKAARDASATDRK
mgnify:CR=1 FL=1